MKIIQKKNKPQQLLTSFSSPYYPKAKKLEK